MKKLFGTDGIRGVAYEFLTHELGYSVGLALGAVLTNGPSAKKVVIGRDTRASGEMLTDAIYRGLCEMGIDVYDVGIAPTPMIAHITATCDFDAGVMISASHNPYEYNGIKIFGRGGFKLSDEDEEKIEALIENSTEIVRSETKGRMIPSPDLRERYTEYLRGICKRGEGLFAVIDCANGSAASTAKDIFSAYGIKTDFIGCSPDGRNINEGCGSTKLDAIKKRVVELGADIGIAFDGDADRCLAVDKNGCEIDGDHIMAILSLSLKEKGRLNKSCAVGTVMTNYGFGKFAKKHGISFLEASVGDRYVLELIERDGLSLGGEQSGHIIIREAATTGDGQLTAIYLLNRMIETKCSAEELASVITKYPQSTVNIPATAADKEAIKNSSEVENIISGARERLRDRGRILVRPSGTEPLVRITVESDSEELTASVCNDVACKIKDFITKK